MVELDWKSASYLGVMVLLTNFLFIVPPTIRDDFNDWETHSFSSLWDLRANETDCGHAATGNATVSLFTQLDKLQSILFRYAQENRWLIITVVALIPVFASLYTFFFAPFDLTMSIEDVESRLEGKKYRGRRPRRSKGALPPPYPNSWYKVMNSHELARGEAKDVELLGQHFVIFRGNDDGKVNILEAYCPHMGANLGVGGTVQGNDIVCPFHGWQFSGDGACTKIPYADGDLPTLPNNAKAWTSTEVNNAIYIWHDAEGREPQWHVPEIKGITDGSWYFHGTSTHTVRAHIQEIPENGADTAHLNYLHTPFVIVVPLIDMFLTHLWSATWEEGKGIESHLAHIRLTHGVAIFGWRIPGSTIDVDITQVGPSTVHLTFNTPVGRVLAIETITPVQALLQRATHQVFAEWRVPRFAAKFILQSTVKQFEKDVPIWNNKTFVRPPMVVKQDGPIAKYRRWFQRNFYSENSERVAREREEAIAGVLDW